MKIIPSTADDYAQVILEQVDETLIKKLERTCVETSGRPSAVEGLRIEVSEKDIVPDEIRASLVSGRFLKVTYHPTSGWFEEASSEGGERRVSVANR
jgi:hypothetical protein